MLLLLNVRRMQGDLQKTLHCVASSTLLVVVVWCLARPTEGQSMPDGNDRAAPHADRYTRRTPARLAFADHMDRLVPGNCAPSAPKRTKMLAGADPAFDGPVILFQDVVK